MKAKLLETLQEERSEMLNSIAQNEFSYLEDKKVFIIDDDEEILNIFKQKLKAFNCFKLFLFNNEFEAINSFMSEKPDIVFVDYNLCQIDGGRVASILKNLTIFDIPIIYISSENLLSKKILAKENIFIEKPLDFNKVYKKIQEKIY